MTPKTGAHASSYSDILKPISFEDGRRLLAASSRTGDSHAVILRGRSLLAVESYEAARVELESVLPGLPAGPIRARVEIDLLTLAYYLAAHARSEELFRSARVNSRGDPLLLAETYLALSLCTIAANDVRRTIDALGFAEDNLRPLLPSRARSLIAGKIYRQRAHVLGQVADYARAAEMAGRALGEAADVRDDMERCRATYTAGFVSLLAGRASKAIALLNEAEQLGRQYGSPLWRWTILCLGRAHAEAGRPLRGTRLAMESGFDAPEEYAFLALCTGDAVGAERVLSQARPATADEAPFRRAVSGIARAELGEWEDSARLLEQAAGEFAIAALRHYEIGARVHAAYARDQLSRGAGRRSLSSLLSSLAEAGAEGFAWFRPAVALWAAERGTRRETQALADTLRRRAFAWGDEAASEDVERVDAWRSRGLTLREVQIVQAIQRQHATGMPERERKELAADLGMSAATLKVHLTSIRQKFGVTERGDNELLAALRDREVAQSERRDGAR